MSLRAGGEDGNRSRDGLVRAAGVLCWRPAPGGGLEVLLVRSARWGDWSWPKGKLDPGESEPECAVRELAEETGVIARLGRPLPEVKYVLPDGRPKQVAYWAGQPVTEQPASAGPEEIAETAWLPASRAMDRLTRPGDGRPLRRLLRLAGRDRLDTRALLVVRHGKAIARSEWPGREADRPLNELGGQQSDELVGLLDCWRPGRVLTSPWRRCRDTIAPFATATGVELVQVPALTESALRDDREAPAAVMRALLAELLADAAGVAMCTHRPVLRPVLAVLADVTGRQTRRKLPSRDPWLRPAETLVAHIGKGSSGPVVRAVERHPVAATS